MCINTYHLVYEIYMFMWNLILERHIFENGYWEKCLASSCVLSHNAPIQSKICWRRRFLCIDLFIFLNPSYTIITLRKLDNSSKFLLFKLIPYTLTYTWLLYLKRFVKSFTVKNNSCDFTIKLVSLRKISKFSKKFAIVRQKS